MKQNTGTLRLKKYRKSAARLLTCNHQLGFQILQGPRIGFQLTGGHSVNFGVEMSRKVKNWRVLASIDKSWRVAATRRLKLTGGKPPVHASASCASKSRKFSSFGRANQILLDFDGSQIPKISSFKDVWYLFRKLRLDGWSSRT